MAHSDVFYIFDLSDGGAPKHRGARGKIPPLYPLSTGLKPSSSVFVCLRRRPQFLVCETSGRGFYPYT